MSDLPPPLTPADCDLRGFEWMALHGHRLFTSGWYLAAMKDPRGGIAALKLWWAAMLQCPAGSLPSDEGELCLLADFGQDMRAWKKHRAVAMRGFILCQDDRYYHPVVAEQAIKAYESRLKASATRQADAERLRRWRASNGSHPPEKPNGQAPPETPYETRFNHRFETPIETRSETRTKRDRQDSTGTSEGEKKESKIKDLLSSTSPASARVVEACEAPPPGTYGDPAIQLAAQTIVEKLGRKFESSGKNPPGRPAKLSIVEQINAVRHGPWLDDDPVLLHGEILEAPIHRGPQPPQRTVAEQLAALGFPQTVLEAAE
jgi:hypothetical protein